MGVGIMACREVEQANQCSKVPWREFRWGWRAPKLFKFTLQTPIEVLAALLPTNYVANHTFGEHALRAIMQIAEDLSKGLV